MTENKTEMGNDLSVNESIKLRNISAPIAGLMDVLESIDSSVDQAQSDINRALEKYNHAVTIARKVIAEYEVKSNE